MKKVIVLSTISAVVITAIANLSRFAIDYSKMLVDAGSLGAFITIFGTLYGIMMAFIVFEVWNEHAKTSALIDAEAQACERLYRLMLYFRDDKMTLQIKRALEKYMKQVIADRFQTLGVGKRNDQLSKTFRLISKIIQDVKFDDDHDQIVFDHVLAQYGTLSTIRTERINQSLMRLPTILRVFVYLSSLIALLSFVVMPFANIGYHLFTVSTLGFILSMIIQLIRDLDNPFIGYWNLTTAPFERALDHIEKNY